ncbi:MULTISPECIES: NAD(P)H-dependent glycerol-3-phosphate dehydrogenase [Psychrilyobacter]|uniref:Glycerol-3-phosphate dehydrogenase [NAD(P)+] n=1 Tax=Psychrilyobacter piezotolerans TaxID=2293438 RepID=A0ABX9KKE3_9FUSO|nr:MULTISPECIES: NAD(P)H-dependent glycerol-3-phosphate dehydrogenase [Psychrilyobacter]MCS5421422.1 NAD(P)H-dependent glycerol-3-phosphate dehydrogenase [Psychrilyobacter sp. S5]NDI76596.1 NAD(P)H-dependent glycerol-3-phosphate dehydrogenase [Psychrilyobacter piezotolerans]RDE65227.1 NAD(P)H-dependent glycerol-3-phosphate dehydrogenase [Psychrilyobacter sp. S5]REI42845.1 NAD(P)H-dependent glycerol-3-phosphate dehydrogenase [Psychrilyobacter piezotolerans]
MGKIVVMGAGSWGTALARIIASKGNNVTLWDYNEERAELLQKSRVNKKFLPNAEFPETLQVTSKIEGLLDGVEYLIMAVPSQVLRSVMEKISCQLTEKTIIVNTAKGIEISTGMRLSQVIKDEILGKFHKNIVILSGPTHAEEVAKNLPSTIVAAGESECAKKIQELFNTENFRVYESNDIIGVELGGAVKNGIAIAAGAADGIGLGDNTKAALITRGLAEMIRFGEALGAKAETFSGLSGMGDLIVTCASTHSRNRYVGQKLGEGRKLQEILDEMEMVAEGVPTVKAVYELAQKKKVSMPILEGVYKVLYEDKLATEMVKELMTRDLKREF